MTSLHALVILCQAVARIKLDLWLEWGFYCCSVKLVISCWNRQ